MATAVEADRNPFKDYVYKKEEQEPPNKRRRFEVTPQLVLYERAPVVREERPVTAPVRTTILKTPDYLEKVNESFKWGSRGFVVDDRECSPREINDFLKKLGRKTKQTIKLKFVSVKKKKKSAEKCKKCQKKYSKASNLKRHERSAH